MAITSDGLKVIGIGQFLFDNFMIVPTNQRSYAWQDEHVEDFWNDIVNALDRNDRNDPDYFIGSIVMSRGENNELEVVDGQQRLATTTIVYGAIRDWLQANNQPEQANLYDRYLLDRDEDTLAVMPKIYLNNDNQAFFKENIVDRVVDGKRKDLLEIKTRRTSKETNKRLAAAADKIRHHIYRRAEGRAPEAVARLKRLAKYLKESVKVILIIVPNHENAYTIFETLNDRGLDLSKADLLKNHIYRTVGPGAKLKNAEAKWSEMMGSLDSVGLKNATVDYIRYFWISERGHVREKGLYAELKRAVIDQAQATGLVETLAENAKLYAAIHNSDHAYWSELGEETKSNLSNLILLGLDRLHPATLAVVRHFKIKEQKKAIHYLLCAAVRIIIAGPPAGTLELELAKKTPLIGKKGAIVDTNTLANEMANGVVPGDAAFKAAFAVAYVSNGKIARYYLRALDNAANDQSDAALVTGEQAKGTVEHILPQKQSPTWNIPEDDAASLRNRIGNQVLLAPNVFSPSNA